MIVVGTEVRRSPIHGHGLFATELIPSGTFIGAFEGKMFTHEQMPRSHPSCGYCLWFCGPGKTYVALLPNDDLYYVNHSKNPSCDLYENVLLFAERDIQPGEEVTFDYGPDWK